MSRRDSLRMCRESEIVVGAQVDDRTWLTLNLEGGAGDRRAQQALFVQGDSSGEFTSPACEVPGWYDRIVAIAEVEIGETELAGVELHAGCVCPDAPATAEALSIACRSDRAL